jgi:hypothetical protein
MAWKKLSHWTYISGGSFAHFPSLVCMSSTRARGATAHQIPGPRSYSHLSSIYNNAAYTVSKELYPYLVCMWPYTCIYKEAYSLWMFLYLKRSRCSSVGIATGYGLDGRGVGVRVPVGSRTFSSPRCPDRLWAHPTSYPMGTGGSFPGDKTAGTWSWPLTSS